jgi:hypothetical protein
MPHHSDHQNPSEDDNDDDDDDVRAETAYDGEGLWR